MTVLVVNCGSSSVKYRLVDPDGRGRVAKGQVERIGTDVADHAAALRTVAGEVRGHLGADGAGGLEAVGHRVVHGGERYTAATLVDDAVLAGIEDLAVLAPLHNPANAEGIRSASAAFPGVPQVAVFDTAFHATLPPAARTYAVPREWRQDHGVRRYGFHGTSHAYVSRVAAAWLSDHRGVDPSAARVVVLHLGNGASACAVLGRRSVDTSMGLTPLAGLVMGTRSGDVDPAVAGHLARVAGLDATAVDEALNRHSGLLGLCGDGDVRAVTERAGRGDDEAGLALDVYAHRIRGYLGAYAVALGGLDAVALTGGVGENSADVRRRVLAGLGWLGLDLDDARNRAADAGHGPAEVSAPGSAAAALVVATDEEGEIARQALDLLRG